MKKQIALKKTLSVNLVSGVGREGFGSPVKFAFYLPSLIFGEKDIFAKIYVFEMDFRLREKVMRFGEKLSAGLRGMNCTCLKAHAEEKTFLGEKFLQFNFYY